MKLHPKYIIANYVCKLLFGHLPHADTIAFIMKLGMYVLKILTMTR